MFSLNKVELLMILIIIYAKSYCYFQEFGVSFCQFEFLNQQKKININFEYLFWDLKTISL